MTVDSQAVRALTQGVRDLSCGPPQPEEIHSYISPCLGGAITSRLQNGVGGDGFYPLLLELGHSAKNARIMEWEENQQEGAWLCTLMFQALSWEGGRRDM